MAQTSWPFENIDTTETQYSQLFRNLGAGVVGSPSGSQLGVTAGTGLSVNVAAGQCMVRGHFYDNSATETLSIATADLTNPRIDSVVLRLDPSANSIVLAVVTGTPASSPVAPTLTQTDAGLFEYLIANVTINASATSVSSIADARSFIGSRVGIWSTTGRPTPTPGAFGYNTTIGSPEVYDGSNWSSLGTPSTISSNIITTSVNSKAGNYTITADDKNEFIILTGSTNYTFTIANVLQPGESVNFIQYGTGQITFAASGVNLYSVDSKLKSNGQYSGQSVVCVSSGNYVLIGNLAA